MTSRHYYVYILASKKDGALYTGVTNDLVRRINEHRQSIFEGHTKKYHIKKLVHVEKFDYIDQALHREKCIKSWKREWKIQLIEKTNSEWADLYEDIQNWL